MCRRSTYKLTWEEIVALYRLTLYQPAQNTHPRFNVCPTTTTSHRLPSWAMIVSMLIRDHKLFRAQRRPQFTGDYDGPNLVGVSGDGD